VRAEQVLLKADDDMAKSDKLMRSLHSSDEVTSLTTVPYPAPKYKRKSGASELPARFRPISLK